MAYGDGNDLGKVGDTPNQTVKSIAEIPKQPVHQRGVDRLFGFKVVVKGTEADVCGLGDLTTASYDRIPPGKTDQASALINAARNAGGSIGVSLASNVLAHREQFRQARLAEHVIPSSVPYQTTFQQVTNYFVVHGYLPAQAQQQATQWIQQQVQDQASYLGYIDAFWLLMVVALATVPLALALRKVKLGGEMHLGH